jgi:hypothetical protein
VSTSTDHPYLAGYDTEALGDIAEWAVDELRDPTPACHVLPATLETLRVDARDILHARALPEHAERVLASPLTEVFLLPARGVKAGHVVLHAGHQPRDPAQPDEPRVVMAVARRLNEVTVTYHDGATVTYGHTVPMDVRTPLWTWTA